MTYFSLVVATKGRVRDLERLLVSLDRQTFTDFEVIVVDQNADSIVTDVLAMPRPYPIAHIRTPGATGACRARNVGWRTAKGQVVLFPDDDCWYPAGFLRCANDHFVYRDCDILTGRAADLGGRSINGRFDKAACWVQREHVWTTSIEWVLFLKYTLLEKLAGFDEHIGIGAETPWQACESQDLVLRGLCLGATCAYDPALFGHHAELNIACPDPAQIKKGRAYARGMGWVLRKHQVSWARRLYWTARPFLKGVMMRLKGRSAAARYYQEVATGRLEGARGRIFHASPVKT